MSRTKLSPEALEARARLDAEHQARTRGGWNGERPLVDNAFGPRTFGDLAEASVGMELYSSPERRANWREEGVGGIIVDGPFTTVDPETGEIARAWKVYDPSSPPDPRSWFHTVHEDQVPADGVTVPDSSSLVTAIRRMVRAVAMRDQTRLDGRELNLLTYALRLAQVVLGER